MHGSRGRRRRLAKGRRNAPLVLHVYFAPAPGAVTFVGGVPTGAVITDMDSMWTRSLDGMSAQLRREAAALRTPPKPKLSAREKYLKRMRGSR